MVKAVVFDCFGVLCSDGWQSFKDVHFSNDLRMYQEAQDLNDLTNSGAFDHDTFLEKVAIMASVDVGSVKKEIMNYQPNEKLFNLISERLKNNYKIGLLSNAPSNWLGDIFQKRHLDVFDAIALSYEIGHVKPMLRPYQVMAERLGFDTNECIFIDDQPRYCIGAEHAGMKAIVYKNYDTLEIDLRSERII